MRSLIDPHHAGSRIRAILWTVAWLKTNQLVTRSRLTPRYKLHDFALQSPDATAIRTSRLSNSLDTGLTAEVIIVNRLHPTPTHLPSYDFAMRSPDIAATDLLTEQFQRHVRAGLGVNSPYLFFSAWLRNPFFNRETFQLHRNPRKGCHTTTASSFTLKHSHIKLS